MPRVLIAGCGYVGTATADLFQAAGWEVEGWTHSRILRHSCRKAVPGSCSRHYRSYAVQGAGRTFNVVIHCASTGGGGSGKLPANLFRRGEQSSSRDLQPQSASSYTSSTSVYAQTNGEWVDEESADRAGSMRREKSCARPKNSLGKMAASWRVWPGIYGPGRSALLRKFLSGEARTRK